MTKISIRPPFIAHCASSLYSLFPMRCVATFKVILDPHTELDNLISTELDNCLISTELDSEISTQLDNCQISTQLDKINFT